MREAEIFLVCNDESVPCHKNIVTGASEAAEDREDTLFFLKEPDVRVFLSVVKREDACGLLCFRQKTSKSYLSLVTRIGLLFVLESMKMNAWV